MAGNINEAQAVLNSMQLLIQVIDDYRKAALTTRTTPKARQRPSEYGARKILLILKTEYARFVNSLAGVFKHRSADTLKTTNWDNANIRAILKSIFGSSLPSFFSTIRQLAECVREIECILKIDDSDKVGNFFRGAFPMGLVSWVAYLSACYCGWQCDLLAFDQFSVSRRSSPPMTTFKCSNIMKGLAAVPRPPEFRVLDGESVVADLPFQVIHWVRVCSTNDSSQSSFCEPFHIPSCNHSGLIAVCTSVALKLYV